MIRGVKGTIDRECAGTGPFVPVKEPCKPMSPLFPLPNPQRAERIPVKLAAGQKELFG